METTNEYYKTKRSPIITFAAIHNRQAWPKADSSKCCIFEAVDLIGRAKYGQEWTGAELQALHWHEQPKVADEVHRAHRAAASVRRPPRPVPVRLSEYMEKVSAQDEHDARIHARNRELKRAAHEAAVKKEQALWEENQRAVDRLSNATEWLAAQCRDGRITAYYRFARGGELSRMTPGDWNVEFPMAQFLAKGGYEKWFHNSIPAMKFLVYVFLDKSELQQAVSIFSHAPLRITDHDISKLSPYLQYAVKLALGLGRNSQIVQEKKEVRKAVIEAEWDSAFPDLPRSNQQVEMLATMVGFPDPDSIKRGMRSGVTKRSADSGVLRKK